MSDYHDDEHLKPLIGYNDAIKKKLPSKFGYPK